MDSDVERNTADIAALDKRMSSHEAMCEERWKIAFNKFSDVEKKINRIESIMIGVAGTLILGGVSTIGTIVMMHS